MGKCFHPTRIHGLSIIIANAKSAVWKKFIKIYSPDGLETKILKHGIAHGPLWGKYVFTDKQAGH